MADEKQQGRGRAKAPAAKKAATKRTVLKRERVIVLPEGVEMSADRQKAMANALGVKASTALKGTEAWIVMGEFVGNSDTRAIEGYAGKNGTPDAKPGVYKAPPTKSWKGGEVYEKPPEPKVERKRLED